MKVSIVDTSPVPSDSIRRHLGSLRSSWEYDPKTQGPSLRSPSHVEERHPVVAGRRRMARVRWTADRRPQLTRARECSKTRNERVNRLTGNDERTPESPVLAATCRAKVSAREHFARTPNTRDSGGLPLNARKG